MRVEVFPANDDVKKTLVSNGVVDVSFMHFRVNRNGDLLVYSRRNHSFLPLEKGGRTVCFLTDNSGRIFQGVADCGKKDNFNYELGRTIAFGRAFKEMVSG